MTEGAIELLFGFLMGFIPVYIGTYSLTGNWYASISFGTFALFAIALKIEGNQE